MNKLGNPDPYTSFAAFSLDPELTGIRRLDPVPYSPIAHNSRGLSIMLTSYKIKKKYGVVPDL